MKSTSIGQSFFQSGLEIRPLSEEKRTQTDTLVNSLFAYAPFAKLLQAKGLNADQVCWISATPLAKGSKTLVLSVSTDLPGIRDQKIHSFSFSPSEKSPLKLVYEAAAFLTSQREEPPAFPTAIKQKKTLQPIPEDFPDPIPTTKSNLKKSTPIPSAPPLNPVVEELWKQSFEDQKTRHRQELKTYADFLSDKNNTLAKTEQELNQLRPLNNRLGETLKTNTLLRKENDLLKGQINKAIHNIKNLEAAFERVHMEHNNESATLLTKYVEADQQLAAANKLLQNGRKQSQKQAEEFQKDHEDTIYTLQTLQDERRQLNAQLQTTQAQLNQTNQALIEARQQAETLNKEQADSLHTIDALREESERRQKQITELEFSRQTAPQQLSQLQQTVQRKEEGLREITAQLDQNKQTLLAERVRLQQQTQALQTLQDEQTQLKEQLQTQAAEFETARNDSQRQRDQLSRELREKTNQLETLKNELLTTQTEAENTMKAMQECFAETQKDSHQSFIKLENRYNQLTEQLQKQEEELTDTKIQLTQITQKLQEEDLYSEAVATDLHNARGDFFFANGELETVRADLQRANAALSHANAELEKARSQNARWQALEKGLKEFTSPSPKKP